jgi:transcriptional regulator GlxA family with amidase domain
MGYNDASHFSREYERLFGLPPLTDAKRLREPPGKAPLGENWIKPHR